MCFRVLLAEEPQAAEVMLVKVTVEFLTGDLVEALAQARIALKSDPDNTNMRSLRSKLSRVLRGKSLVELCYDRREYEAALEGWDTALEVSPDAMCMQSLSEAHIRMRSGCGTVRRMAPWGIYARGCFSTGRKQNSTLVVSSIPILIILSGPWKQLKKHADGLRSIDASLKLHDSSWETHRLRGRIHVALKLFELAVGDFKASVQRASVDASGARLSDIWSLKLELRQTEGMAIKAKNTLKDYYLILGEYTLSGHAPLL